MLLTHAAAVSVAPCASCLATDPFSLAQANINPLTGLSTDYLNHFNEAIMLLDLFPSMPECRPDFDRWRPLDYYAHFARSKLTQRELAMAAYDLADAFTRREFDELCAAMTLTVQTAQKAMATDLSDKAAAMIATHAAARLRPLIARANAVIHGEDAADAAWTATAQAAIDAVLAQ